MNIETTQRVRLLCVLWDGVANWNWVKTEFWPKVKTGYLPQGFYVIPSRLEAAYSLHYLSDSSERDELQHR